MIFLLFKVNFENKIVLEMVWLDYLDGVSSFFNIFVGKKVVLYFYIYINIYDYRECCFYF